MASVNLDVAPFFPAGTTLYAFRFDTDDPDGRAAPVASTATATVSAGGFAAFTGLADGTGYWVGTGASPYQYIGLNTSPATGSPDSGGSGGPAFTLDPISMGSSATLSLTDHPNAKATINLTAGASPGTLTLTGMDPAQRLVMRFVQPESGDRTVRLTVGAQTSTIAVDPTANATTLVLLEAFGATDIVSAIVGSGVNPGDPTLPAQITGPIVVAANQSGIVSWTAPYDGGSAITDYTVQYRPGTSGSWTTLSDAVSTATAATITGLTNGNAYQARVAAINAIGTGTFSDPVAFTPADAATSTTDSFTDTAGVLLTAHNGGAGATWTKHSGPGDMVISNANRARSVSGGGIFYPAAVPASPNYYVEAAFFFASDAGQGDGIVGRLDPVAQTYYYARLNLAGGAEAWELYKTVAGAFTLLGDSPASGTVGTTATVRLTMTGTTIKLSVNGTDLITVTDSSITAVGRGGFRCVDDTTNTTGTHADSFALA